MTARRYPPLDDWQLITLTEAQRIDIRAYLLTVHPVMGCAAVISWGVLFPRFDFYGLVMLMVEYPDFVGRLADEIIFGSERTL